jgi:hypothetical protein
MCQIHRQTKAKTTSHREIQSLLFTYATTKAKGASFSKNPCPIHPEENYQNKWEGGRGLQCELQGMPLVETPF